MRNVNLYVEMKNLDSDFLAIKSLFESGNVRSMRLLEEQAPTKMSRSLGINYNSYLEKLRCPDKFTIRHLLKMAKLCELDPLLIFNVIRTEVS